MFFSRPVGHRYIDRGDPSAYDYTFSAFTKDNNWHELDLSSIIGTGHKLVHCRLIIKDGVTDVEINFRQNGNSNSFNLFVGRVLTAGIYNAYDFFVYCDIDGVIEYKATNAAFSEIYLLVRGWLRP